MASHDQSYKAGEIKGQAEVWGIVLILCLYMVPNDCVGVVIFLLITMHHACFVSFLYVKYWLAK